MDDFETRLQAERDAWCDAHDMPVPGSPTRPTAIEPQTFHERELASAPLADPQFHERSLARALDAKALTRSRQRAPGKRRRPSIWDTVRKPSMHAAAKGLSQREREQLKELRADLSRPGNADHAGDEAIAVELILRAAFAALPEHQAADAVERLAQDQAHGAIAAAARKIGASESTVRSRWSTELNKICKAAGVSLDDEKAAEEKRRKHEEWCAKLRNGLREHQRAERAALAYDKVYEQFLYALERKAPDVDELRAKAIAAAQCAGAAEDELQWLATLTERPTSVGERIYTAEQRAAMEPRATLPRFTFSVGECEQHKNAARDSNGRCGECVRQVQRDDSYVSYLGASRPYWNANAKHERGFTSRTRSATSGLDSDTPAGVSHANDETDDVVADIFQNKMGMRGEAWVRKQPETDYEAQQQNKLAKPFLKPE